MAIEIKIDNLRHRGVKLSYLALKASGEVSGGDWLIGIKSSIDSCEGRPPPRFLIDNSAAVDIIGLEDFRGIVQLLSDAGLSAVRFALVSSDPMDYHRMDVFKSCADEKSIALTIGKFLSIDEARRWLVD